MFKNHGADSDERIEWTLHAFLAYLPTNMPAVCGPGLSNELLGAEIVDIPEHGVAVITEPRQMAAVAEELDLGHVPSGSKVLIIARWAYYWCGVENDYERLKTLDGLVNYLENAPGDLVIRGEVSGDVD